MPSSRAAVRAAPPPPALAAAVPGLSRLRRATAGDPRVLVALLDGPADLRHPDLAGGRVTCRGDVAPCGGAAGLAHGTFVASVVAGAQGIAPGCRALVLPVYATALDGGLVRCAQRDLARALLLARDAGAAIVNVSGGELAAPGARADPTLAAAVRACAAAGVLVVAAAGNDGCDCVHLPAALPGVLAVGAMDGGARPAPLSNWGAAYRASGLLAPGVRIPGASPGGGRTARSGTSAAAAVVSGLAALLVSLQLTLGRAPDPLAVRDALLATAAGCDAAPAVDCRHLLAGRLNVEAALQTLSQGGRQRMSSNGRIAIETENAPDAPTQP
ncbi:MAG TPA: S8 family serine peptidase, partial [Candidatus Thermoplasmatota archaeon]|nr:S8 family serine peptidase [Candidatus Thermoplasmatota archaeon]